MFLSIFTLFTNLILSISASKKGHWESDGSNTIRLFGTYMTPGVAPGKAGSRESREKGYEKSQTRVKRLRADYLESLKKN